MRYSKDFIDKVDSIKQAVVALADKVNNQEEAGHECGIVSNLISAHWPHIDKVIFTSEEERQLDAVIREAYR